MDDKSKHTQPLHFDEPLAARLQRRLGFEIDPLVTLHLDHKDDLPRPDGGPEAEVDLGRDDRMRYGEAAEIARGGMGVVCSVWDHDLRRELAMKVIRSAHTPAPGSSVSKRALMRFLEEAQITGQLEHPGIVSVHDVGLDARGRMFFTMQLVRGRELGKIFDLAQAEQEGWNRTRALGALLKVCEAMAYAHAKGVIHRDLKPSNVMVGRFGEVLVMDWGVARVHGEEDRHDVRLRSDSGELERVSTDRRKDVTTALQARGTELYTMDGDVVGTPAYMSPEQAAGRTSELDGRTDVYSIGAMLYHLLTGHAPFVIPGASTGPGALLMKLLEGPPPPVHERAEDVPAELSAICDRAMAREAADRYPDMSALAEDLRAFLEQRVVSAYETGAGAELRKWVQRNKSLAAAIGASLFIALAGLTAVGVVQANGRRVAAAEREVAVANAKIAAENEREARRERANVLRLSAFQELEDLTREAEGLWPIEPASEQAFGDWLERAESLVAGLDPDPTSEDQGHRAQLVELRRRGRATEEGASAGWTFEREEDRWWHSQVERLVTEIEAFADPETGLMGGRVPGSGPGVGLRLSLLESTRDRSQRSPSAVEAWERAIDEIAGQPEYGGLLIARQWGLVPLGPDPYSGLQEFAHVLSGEVPLRDDEGRLVMEEASALVLVLIPGSSFGMGSIQGEASADPHEQPLQEVDLDPYFISKYELTQGQWMHFTGVNPARYGIGTVFLGTATTLEHPVESVSWIESERVLLRMGLALPTEAQWECAARGGTDTPWWPGDDREYLIGLANLADQTARRAGANFAAIDDWPELNDGWPLHAPVDAFPPNDFGLHGVLGNVKEWCLEGFVEGYTAPPEPGDGRLGNPSDLNRAFRGGSFASPSRWARSAYRGKYTPDVLYNDLGLRPVRGLER